MSAMHIQESDLPSSEHTDPALDRAIERMLEAEMAKGLITSFHEDFDRLMKRLDAMSIAQHAAMDKLLQRLRSS
jgi:hypothetical protein